MSQLSVPNAFWGGNLGITFALKMADNNDLINFELKCCIIEAFKEQQVHIYDKADADHFNRAKHEASFNEIGTLLGVDGK